MQIVFKCWNFKKKKLNSGSIHSKSRTQISLKKDADDVEI